MKIKCRIGWHNWGKWKKVQKTLVSYYFGVIIPDSSHIAQFNTKICLDCNYFIGREIY